MSNREMSFFDEKRGTIKHETEWGCWWQTVQEVHIQVKLEEKVSAKEIKLLVQPKYIKCLVRDKIIFEGELPRTVYANESIWTIEDNNLCILLAKSDYSIKDDMWESLLVGKQYQPDPLTLHEMRKNLDLERFQMENPGMDFSGAQLSKNYDRLPGWQNERLEELKLKNAEKINEKAET